MLALASKKVGAADPSPWADRTQIATLGVVQTQLSAA